MIRSVAVTKLTFKALYNGQTNLSFYPKERLGQIPRDLHSMKNEGGDSPNYVFPYVMWEVNSRCIQDPF